MTERGEERARTRRVFFALWPDAEAASHLAALAHALTARGGGRTLRPATLHLTLAFVGAVTPERLATLMEIAGDVRGDAFDLTLDRLGFWPQRGIFWAGCRQPPRALRQLADALSTGLRAAGFGLDPRSAAQTPHVTLARRARCHDVPRLATPVTWRAERFVLAESHLHPSAASYGTLAEFPLAQPGTGGHETGSPSP